MLIVALASAWWQYFVLLLSSSRSPHIHRTLFQWYFNVKSHWKYLFNYQSRKFVFCLHFFIDGVESAWPACYFFSSGSHMDYGSLCIIQKKIPLLALKLHYTSSRIFQVTGLAFSPWKCKFIVCILARTHKGKVLTECCLILGSILVKERLVM